MMRNTILTILLIGNFFNGISQVNKFEENGKMGLKKDSSIIVAPIYDYIGDFIEGYANVYLEGNEGLINENGTEIIPVEYDFIIRRGHCNFGSLGGVKTYRFSCETMDRGYFTAVRSHTPHIFDSTGTELQINYSFPATDYPVFHNGLMPVHENDLYGYVNTKGELVIPFTYSIYDDFHEGFAKVCQPDSNLNQINGEVCTYIDTNGNEIMPFVDEYNGLTFFSEGLALFMQDHHVKFIDSTGSVVLDLPQYYDALYFSEGLCPVRSAKSYKWGFMDKTGKLVIPCKYKYVHYGFKNGVAKVNKSINEKKAFYISWNGSEVILVDQTGKMLK